MLNIDKLQEQVDACISSSIALYRLEGKYQTRTYHLNLKDVLVRERVTEQMVEQVLHYLAFRMIKARMSQLAPGELYFEIDLTVVALNLAQCEQFNAAVNFEPEQSQNRLHLITNMIVDSAIDQMLATNKLLPTVAQRPDTQELRKYLVSRRINFRSLTAETLEISVDLTKVIFTREQRAVVLPVLGRLLNDRARSQTSKPSN